MSELRHVGAAYPIVLTSIHMYEMNIRTPRLCDQGHCVVI